jgi:predicted dehydrogenase
LVEKPPGRTAAEFRQTLGSRREDRVFRVGFNHRLHGSLQAAREILASGRIGRLEAVEGVYERPWLAKPGQWRGSLPLAGGGILLDQGIHLLDAIRWLVGPLTLRSHTVRGLPLETSVEAVFDSLGTAVQIASRADAPGYRFELVLRGRLGTLRLSGLETSSRAYAPEQLHLTGDGAPKVETWNEDPSWTAEVDAFVRHALDGEDDGHGDPRDALAVLKLVDRLRQPATGARA